MGAKHPQAVIDQLRCNKNEFILAARHLVKTGVAKSPGDAIRYMEENNTDVAEIVEQIILSKQTKLITETDEEENEDTGTESTS
jgi:hypothetical protein